LGRGEVFLLRSGSRTLLPRGKRQLFLYTKEKVAKRSVQACRLSAVGYGEKRPQTLRGRPRTLGTVRLAQGCCAACGSFGELDQAATLRFARGASVRWRFPHFMISSPPSKTKRVLRLFSYGIYRCNYSQNSRLTPHASLLSVPIRRAGETCVMRTDMHRANQIDKIGASAEIPSPLLSGIDAISQTHCTFGNRKAYAGLLIGAGGREERSVASFLAPFFFQIKKKVHLPLRRRKKRAPIFELYTKKNPRNSVFLRRRRSTWLPRPRSR